MKDENEKFVNFMLDSAKKKFDPMPPEKRRELTDEEQENVDNFLKDLKRGIINR
ncbi:hypothetical protein JXB31_02310 [Candidatus Woesearchaeota archaeon]|nr:hypothetical protein [Candidatus Woesearchaeota archaeon]